MKFGGWGDDLRRVRREEWEGKHGQNTSYTHTHTHTALVLFWQNANHVLLLLEVGVA